MARLTASIVLSLTFAARAVFSAEAARTGELPSALAAPKAATAPTQPARPKSVSPAVAAILATQVPKFDPNAPKPQARLEEQPEDKPKNPIIRLDPMVVRDMRTPIRNPLIVLTKDALAEYAFKRYITSEVDRALNRFTIPLFGMSMRDRAMIMYRDEERLRNMADVADMARIVSLTDAEAGMYIKKTGEQTYMRKSDFGYQGGRSPSGNR